MINSIISGISVSIFEEFGEGYEIYTERVEQGLKEPCFLISSLSQSSKQFFASRYKKDNLFTVQYFPSTDEIKAECNDVAERLNGCLEWININGDLIRGTNINSQITDDVLHTTVSYNFFAVSKSKDNVDVMSDYSVQNNVKE